MFSSVNIKEGIVLCLQMTEMFNIEPEWKLSSDSREEVL